LSARTITKSELLLSDMHVTCRYVTYSLIGPAVSQGTYDGPVAQALELYSNYLGNNERHTIRVTDLDTDWDTDPDPDPY